MIELKKLNDEPILINPLQIEYIEIIPESKIIMMNGRYHIVKDERSEIVRQITQFYNECINRKFNWED